MVINFRLKILVEMGNMWKKEKWESFVMLGKGVGSFNKLCVFLNFKFGNEIEI